MSLKKKQSNHNHCILIFTIIVSSFHYGQSEDMKILLWASDLLKWKQPNCLKSGKTQMTKSWLVIVLHLNGWESGASFLDQSQSKVNLNWSYHRSLLTLLKISLSIHSIVSQKGYEKKGIGPWYPLCWYSTSAKNTTRIMKYDINVCLLLLNHD